MIKRLLLFLLLCASYTLTFAQVIDATALNSYRPSVVSKVYEVAIQVSLTSAEQTALAGLFTSQEDELSQLILSGASAASIENVKARHITDFNNTLSSQKIEAYYSAKVAAKGNVVGRLTGQMLQDKYGTDPTTRQYFTNMYSWKETAMEKAWLVSTDTVSRNNRIAAILYAYDTLITRYLYAVEGSNYFSSRVGYIESILPIESSRKQQLSSQYYNYCMANRTSSYADNFNNAFQSVFNALDDTAYYWAAYEPEIGNSAHNASDIALGGYVKTYKLSSLAIQQMTPYIAGRERGIALVNKLYPTYDETKDRAVKSILEVYQPSIDSIIALDADIMETTQIDIAIKFAVELQLTAEQYDQLREARKQLEAMVKEYRDKDPYGEFDSKEFESESLNNILQPEQYTQVLTSKYQGKATGMAKTDWQQIGLYNMDDEYGFTEASTKLELSNYHLAIFISYYRYANNPEEQYLSIRRINEVMPEAMRHLLERWEYKTPYGDTPDIFFQW